MIATLYLGLYIIAGLWIACSVFSRESAVFRFLLGLVFGVVLYAWCPAVMAFFFGFTRSAHIFALLIPMILVCVFTGRGERRYSALRGAGVWGRLRNSVARNKVFLSLATLTFLFVVQVLWHHTLTFRDGAFWTGQATYGDMAMHLSFITSLAKQGAFPPEYSILPGTLLSYPFLCDSISSSMMVLGAGLRWAYYLPMMLLFLTAFLGFYLLAKAVLRWRGAAVLAWVMVFFNGGIGFIYFFGRFFEIFTEFYHTPTNFTDFNLRWSNLIADMMIPQRAMLMGLAVGFAAILLLYKAVFERRGGYLPWAAAIIGLMPMMHTHTFLAVSVVAVCWFLVSYGDRESLFDRQWLVFAGIVVALAMPQLIFWTFRQTMGGQNFLKIHWNWVNEKDNYFWFYVKNMGVFAVFLVPALAALWRKRWRFAVPAVVLWGLVEVVQFTPNVYDNNKLLYIAYAMLAIVVCEFLAMLYGWVCGQLDGWLDGQLDGWLDGQLDGWLDRRVWSQWFVKIGAAAVVFVMTFSAVLTLGREAVSEYQIFGEDMVAAAEFVENNTPVDAMFLTADNHNNAIAALAGRTIVCGSGVYLFFHGTNYEGQGQDAKKMLERPLENPDLFEKYKVEYAVIGPYERGGYDVDERDFEEWGEVVYDDFDVRIYRRK